MFFLVTFAIETGIVVACMRSDLFSNIVLVSISYERSRFIIEVQTKSYDQLQEYVDLVNSMGLNVNLGASRRVKNIIRFIKFY